MISATPPEAVFHMLELNSMDFMRAATSFARVNQILAGISSVHHEKVAPDTAAVLLPPIAELRREAEKVGATLTVKAIDRLEPLLKATPCTLTVGQAHTAVTEIEMRFSDYLADVKMFALAPGEAGLMGNADEGFALRFPQASFELEESSKCLALGRHTASVFHSMRMLEYGIRALAKRLDIPDPTRAAEKNWAIILGAIQAKLDETWPKSKRLPKSEGAALETAYSHLETVRNPWRNATMHVETIYAPHEALHILRCSAFFMVTLSNLIDEDGNPIEPPNPLGLEAPEERG
ncbi:MAG: hypothetical protein HOP95_01345 [Sphingomonas sp.]|nr:hypothetical protein [Sphingomonas sp.]